MKIVLLVVHAHPFTTHPSCGLRLLRLEPPPKKETKKQKEETFQFIGPTSE